MSKYKFIDLFAGIGGTRLGFESAGAECVFTSEWDKYAQKTYFENFGDMPAGDIAAVESKDIPDFDILLAGFPCQPFSIAGVSKNISLGRKHGFDHEKQGNLFFEIARILQDKRPSGFMLENVKNLVSHDNKNTFKVILGILDELDYEVDYRVVDGKKLVPQHRERTYILGVDRRRAPKGFKIRFPDVPDNQPKLKSILEDNAADKYTLTDGLWTYLQNYAAKHKKLGNGFGYGIADPEGTTRTLSARYYKDGSEVLIAQAGKNPRRLTPRECARLMGFKDNFKIPVSDTQAYKQFGNSIIVPVVEYMAKTLVGMLDEINGQDNKVTPQLEHVQNKKHQYHPGAGGQEISAF